MRPGVVRCSQASHFGLVALHAACPVRHHRHGTPAPAEDESGACMLGCGGRRWPFVPFLGMGNRCLWTNHAWLSMRLYSAHSAQSRSQGSDAEGRARDPAYNPQLEELEPPRLQARAGSRGSRSWVVLAPSPPNQSRAGTPAQLCGAPAQTSPLSTTSLLQTAPRALTARRECTNCECRWAAFLV